MSTTDPRGASLTGERSLLSLSALLCAYRTRRWCWTTTPTRCCVTDPPGGSTDRGAESAISERLVVRVQDEEVVLDYDTDSVLCN